MSVLVEAPFHVSGDSCIERVARAKNNINLPAHHCHAIRTACLVNPLIDFLFLTVTASAFG
jgi:hypothetical protein